MGKQNNMLEYKGYHSVVEYDVESRVLHGKIEGISDLVTYECDDIKNVEKEFKKAVDDYLIFCEEIGQEPDKEYKGSFNIRIEPELHKKLVLISVSHDESLNNCIEGALRRYVESEERKLAKKVKKVS